MRAALLLLLPPAGGLCMLFCALCTRSALNEDPLPLAGSQDCDYDYDEV